MVQLTLTTEIGEGSCHGFARGSVLSPPATPGPTWLGGSGLWRASGTAHCAMRIAGRPIEG